jgi:putative ABC transport system permease protein
MHLVHDLRFAARSFLKTPGVTIAAVLSIALGIAATTTVFTLVNAVLFRPMPVPHPEQLVALYTTEPTSLYPSAFSFPEYLDYREAAGDVFSDLFVHSGRSLGFSARGEKSELVWGELVTGNYFAGLGVVPAAGRVLTPEDDRTSGAHPVVVLSHAFWQRRFGGDPRVVGTNVKLTGHEYTVVGVARKGFSGTRLTGFIPDVWVPLSMHGQIAPALKPILEDRDADAFDVNGRLRAGVTIDQATAAIKVIADRLAQTYPTTNARRGVGMVPAGNKTQPAITLLGYIPIAARTLLAVVTLVLLIACGSVANLILARASTRRREIAMRLACGAPRGRIVGQLLTESVLLALGGGLAGLLLAQWFNGVVPGFAPQLDFSTIDFEYDLTLDYRVLFFAAATTMLTGIATGLLPALQASRVDLLTALQARDANATSYRRRLNVRNTLVVAQIAFSLALVVCAGVFVRSMQSAQRIDVGFESRDALLVSVDLGLREYERASGLRYFERAVEAIRALPGVAAATVGGPLPLDSYGIGTAVAAVGDVPRDEHERLDVGYSVVGLDYFPTMRTPLVAGRAFTAADTADARHVVVVNETMARRFWPNQTAIGQRVRLGDDASGDVEVVGIARDGKYNLLGEPATEYFFVPHAQHYRGRMTFVARTTGSPAALASAVQREIAALDPDVPIYGVRTMPRYLDRLLSLPKTAAVLVALFAFVALVMASVSLYGLVSYSVARRTKEIGLRMAVGAGRGDVMWMVFRQSGVLAIAGVGIGVVAAFALMRLAASLLYGVGPHDPATLVGGTLLLVVVTLVASYAPARRAMRLDPTLALRHE